MRIFFEKSYQTEVGTLLNIRPPPRKKATAPIPMEFLGSQTCAKVQNLLRKQFVVFPENYTYNLSLKFFHGVQKNLYKSYMRKNERAYKRCSDIKDKFHVYRNITHNTDLTLSHIGYWMNKDFSLNIKKAPETTNCMKELLQKMVEDIPDSFMDSLCHPDFYISLLQYQDILQASRLEEGENHQDFPSHNSVIKGTAGVRMPSVEESQLFWNYCQELRKLGLQNGLELFGNSGYMSVMLGFAGIPEVTFIGETPESLKAFKLNEENTQYESKYTQLRLILSHKARAERLFTKFHQFISKKYTSLLWDPKFENSIGLEDKFYDIIVAHFPPLHCSKVASYSYFANVENDPKGYIMNTTFKFAADRLNSKGNLIVLYSNYGEYLGLQERNIVPTTAKKYNFSFINGVQSPFVNNDILPWEFHEDIKDATSQLFHFVKN